MKKMLVLVLCGIAIVILASSMSYQQQTIIPTLKNLLQDKPFENWLSQFEFHYWGTIISVETRGYYNFVEFLVRKATHFFGYGILAVIFYFFYSKIKWRLPAIFAFLTIVGIASLDEYRQSMIPGRTGIVSDVIIDACGAFVLITVIKFSQLTKAFYRKKVA